MPKAQVRGGGSGSRSNERPLSDIAAHASQAKKCRCKTNGYEPWLERDPDDGGLHCLRCGSDYTRGVR